MPRMRKSGATSATSSNPDRKVKSKKDTNMRSKATINRLNMYKKSGALYNKGGKLIGGDLMAKDRTGNKPMEKMARVAPNRRWFGNTRVISQRELDDFRDRMTEKVADPYTVLLRRKRLPMGLLIKANAGNTGKAVKNSMLGDLDAALNGEDIEVNHCNLLSNESYSSVFGPKKTRKRPKVASNSLQDLISRVQKKTETYASVSMKDSANLDTQGERERKIPREDIFSKGKSKRIWQELHKVIDCSDVVVQVLDARDPDGTRSKFLEAHIKKNCPHKHLIFILNKVDLVPNYISKHYVKTMSKDFPTLAFHASLTKPFGKGSLIQLLRQFAALHPEKKQISVGFVGFPNVGKSSIINALKSKKVCKVAPIPGETKVWQYITLFKRVFLIDCPGIVYPDRAIADFVTVNDESTPETERPAEIGSEGIVTLTAGQFGVDSLYVDRDLKYEAELVMKGVVRAERLESPEEYIDYMLSKLEKKQLESVYGVEGFSTGEEFLTKVAKKRGRLLKGGEPDYRAVAQQVINDLQRGKIPYFVIPEELKDVKESSS